MYQLEVCGAVARTYRLLTFAIFFDQTVVFRDGLLVRGDGRGAGDCVVLDGEVVASDIVALAAAGSHDEFGGLLVLFSVRSFVGSFGLFFFDFLGYTAMLWFLLRTPPIPMWSLDVAVSRGLAPADVRSSRARVIRWPLGWEWCRSCFSTRAVSCQQIIRCLLACSCLPFCIFISRLLGCSYGLSIINEIRG